MKAKRKTEIELQLEEVITVRTRQSFSAHCPQCRRLRQMIPPDEAALIAGVSAREVYRLVEAGQVHFTEDRHGLLYVCLASVQALMADKARPETGEGPG